MAEQLSDVNVKANIKPFFSIHDPLHSRNRQRALKQAQAQNFALADVVADKAATQATLEREVPRQFALERGGAIRRLQEAELADREALAGQIDVERARKLDELKSRDDSNTLANIINFGTLGLEMFETGAFEGGPLEALGLPESGTRELERKTREENIRTQEILDRETEQNVRFYMDSDPMKAHKNISLLRDPKKQRELYDIWARRNKDTIIQNFGPEFK